MEWRFEHAKFQFSFACPCAYNANDCNEFSWRGWNFEDLQNHIVVRSIGPDGERVRRTGSDGFSRSGGFSGQGGLSRHGGFVLRTEILIGKQSLRFHSAEPQYHILRGFSDRFRPASSLLAGTVEVSPLPSCRVGLQATSASWRGPVVISAPRVTRP